MSLLRIMTRELKLFPYIISLKRILKPDNMVKYDYSYGWCLGPENGGGAKSCCCVWLNWAPRQRLMDPSWHLTLDYYCPNWCYALFLRSQMFLEPIFLMFIEMFLELIYLNFFRAIAVPDLEFAAVLTMNRFGRFGLLTKFYGFYFRLRRENH